MKELDAYIQRCFDMCQHTAGKAKEIQMAHAFGAMDIYALLHPGQEQKIHDLWTSKWYPNFIEEIWGYRP